MNTSLFLFTSPPPTITATKSEPGTYDKHLLLYQHQAAFVAYVKNNNILAIGKPMQTRKQLQGKKFPDGSLCTELIYADNNVPATIVIGKEDDNLVLRAKVFFALPTKDLFYASYRSDRKTLVLSSFS